MNKYDAKTGKHLGKFTLPAKMQQYYISANGKVGAGTGSKLSVYYNTINGNQFGNFKKYAGGCSAAPSPEGKYLIQNTWPHKVLNVFELPGPKKIASVDINRASSIGLNGKFIWNHQLMAQQSAVVVMPVGTDNGKHQLDGHQYPAFYDIVEKKLIWMTKTKPGGNLTTHPYDFYKGKPKDATGSFVKPKTSTLAKIPLNISKAGNTYVFDISVTGRYYIEIVNIQGVTLQRLNGNGTSRLEWKPRKAFGVYLMHLVAENQTAACNTVVLR